jgi:Ribbon-helix-helix protein, copG family
MRTTVTLAEDVAAAVERVRRDRGVGVSEAVNDLVRAGLVARPGNGATFRQTTSRMGAPRIPLDDVQAALDALEGDGRR